MKLLDETGKQRMTQLDFLPVICLWLHCNYIFFFYKVNRIVNNSLAAEIKALFLSKQLSVTGTVGVKQIHMDAICTLREIKLIPAGKSSH